MKRFSFVFLTTIFCGCLTVNAMESDKSEKIDRHKFALIKAPPKRMGICELVYTLHRIDSREAVGTFSLRTCFCCSADEGNEVELAKFEPEAGYADILLSEMLDEVHRSGYVAVRYNALHDLGQPHSPVSLLSKAGVDVFNVDMDQSSK